MKRFFLLSALLVMSILAGWAQTEQPTETGFGIIFSDGSTIKGELCAEDGDTAYVIQDQVIAKEQSFKLYDFGTQTVWVTSQHAYLNEHISIQNDSYMPDSTAAYGIVIWKDSLIIALPGDMPVPNYSGNRGGSQASNEFTVDSYTYILWKDYTYYFWDESAKVKIPGTIAMVKAYTGSGIFCPPETVTYNGQSYPVAVLMEEINEPSFSQYEIRIKPSIKCIEYYALARFSSTVYSFIVEDSTDSLYIWPSRNTFDMGSKKISGGLYRFENMNYCYFGRNIRNCSSTYSKKERFGPLAGWPVHYATRHLQVVFGPKVNKPGHHFFYDTPLWRIDLTVEALNPPTIDSDIFSKTFPSSSSRPKAMVYAKQKEVYNKITNWKNNFTIEELSGSGISGGTKWELGIIGNPGACTGYKMTISPLGNGKMEDKNNASDYGWYNHHKVIHELDIAGGVTHISKLGWDGYSLKTIYLRAAGPEPLPAIGKDALRGVDTSNIILYVHSTKREELDKYDCEWLKFGRNVREIDVQNYQDSTIKFMERICNGYLEKDSPIKGYYNNYESAIRNTYKHEQVEQLEEEFLSVLFAKGSGSGEMDKPYLISNVDQLILYSRITADAIRTKYWTRCARLTDDIDATEKGTEVILGKSATYPYRGTFDGDKHFIKLNISYGSTPAAFISYMSSGTIKNLILKGNITNTGSGKTSWLSGFIGVATLDREPIRIENCVSAVTLTNTNGGFINLGGFVGELSIMRQDGSGDMFISNSCFVGGINAPIGQNIGGLIGCASSSVTLKDSYVSPAFVKGNDNPWRSNTAALVNMTEGKEHLLKIDNCYFYNIPENFEEQSQGTKIVKDSIIVCGELCYALNKGVIDGSQAWYQYLSEDAYRDSIPRPFSWYKNDIVYKNKDGEYNNICTHRFDGRGFCTLCGAINPDAKEVTISSNEQMQQWAALVNEGHGDVSVKLAADVNYEYIGEKVTYKGTFDGQGHKVFVKLGDPAKPVMWTNFAGTLRNTYFELKFPTISNRGAINNFALINNCMNAQIENCDFRLAWGFENWESKFDVVLGGIINTISGQVSCNNCAFLGKISYPVSPFFQITHCVNLFVRDGNAGRLSISNSYEYIFFENVYPRVISYSSSLPMSKDKNCYRYDNLESITDMELPNDLADKLNGTQSPKPWKWVDKQDVFKRIPVPFERSASREGKQAGNEFTVDGYTYVLWENYSYFFQDKDVTVTLPGTIAAVKAFTPNDTAAFCPPQTVTYENRSYPVAVIMENMTVPHPAKTREIRIHPSIRCIEYSGLANFQDTVQNVIIEDSEEPLYLGPSRSGGQLEFAGGLSQLKFLTYCYVGRNIINCKPEWNKNYGPLAGWRGDDSGKRLSVVLGPMATQPGHHFFYGADIAKIEDVTVKAFNPPTIDYEIFSNPAPLDTTDKPKAKVYPGQKELYTKNPNWNANFTIEELPPYAGVSAGTMWYLTPVFNLTGDTCTGYKMNVSSVGTGIMEDKDKVSDHGWYKYRDIMIELDIAGGVTHISKLGWDSYSLQAIYLRAIKNERFPTIGADAFRGLNRSKTILYVHSSKSKALAETADWKEFTNVREIDIQAYRDSTIDFMKRICDGYLQKGHPINDLYEKYVNAINNVYLHEEVARLEEEFVRALFAAGSGSGLQDEPYLIANVDQLIFYSRLTEDKVRVSYAECCARMTADIDATEKGAAVIFGKEKDLPYCGTLDGDKHYLKLNISVSDNPAAFIRYMESGTIKNLIFTGAISVTTSEDESQPAGLIGVVTPQQDVRIENCVSAVTITNPNGGAIGLGGLVGESSADGGEQLLISNSCFVGRIDAPKASYIGGLVGKASSDVTLKDCFVSSNTTTLINAEGVTIDNCYINPVKDSIVCGALCYALTKGVVDGSQAWYQYLSNPKDSIPYPFSRYSQKDAVTRNKFGKYENYCDHIFDANGFCTLCGAINPDVKEVTISSNDNMRRWAELVNAGYGDVSVKLAADVNYEYIGKNVTYTGTFDGQGYKVTVDFEKEANTKPAMWANFAGTIRNTYFELTIPLITTSLVNNFALFDNCQGTIERCLFRANWSVGNASTYRLGGLINTISGQTCFNDCAFLGYIVCHSGFRDVKCDNLFIRDVNKNLTTFTNCLEDVYYRLLNYIDFSYDRFIPNATSSPTNCYMYGGEYDPHETHHNIHYTTLDNLNDGRSVWEWFDVDQVMFQRRPVPFKQCGIHWNGGEGGEDALPQILAPAQRAINNKYMENGHVIIQRNNTYYDIFGKEL